MALHFRLLTMFNALKHYKYVPRPNSIPHYRQVLQTVSIIMAKIITVKPH